VNTGHPKTAGPQRLQVRAAGDEQTSTPDRASFPPKKPPTPPAPTTANVKTLRQIASTICRRDGVEAIVLAGTDLTLIFSEASAGFPTVTAPPPTSRGSSAGR
jgi:hypothetical protein